MGSSYENELAMGHPGQLNVEDVYDSFLDSPHYQTMQTIAKMVRKTIGKMAKKIRVRGKKAFQRHLLHEAIRG